jgi:putative PIN family toxin of toxin-antitoxin system
VRVVFDTNIVLSALVFGRRLAWLRGAWARGVVVPVVCRETTAELLRVLSYPKFELTRTERGLLLAEYLPFAEVARLPASLPILPVACRDRDDVVFIQLAVAAKIDWLVSEDSRRTSRKRHRSSLPCCRSRPAAAIRRSYRAQCSTAA